MSNMSKLTTEYLVNNLYLVLVNTKYCPRFHDSNEYITRRPSWDYNFGGGEVLEVLTARDNSGVGYITPEILAETRISLEAAWTKAEQNTKNAVTVMDVLDLLLGSNEPLQFAGMVRHLRAGRFLSLTNRDENFGASGIAVSRNLLEGLATAIEDDIILIPSSIHEVLVVPASIMEGREDEIPDIIGEVNIDPGKIRSQDVLGDKPYYIRLEDI